MTDCLCCEQLRRENTDLRRQLEPRIQYFNALEREIITLSAQLKVALACQCPYPEVHRKVDADGSA